MKNTIPTSEEFYQSAINDNSIGDDITDLMNAYAKMHVEAALKEASKQKTHGMMVVPLFNEEQQNSILKSYPLTNIK